MRAIFTDTIQQAFAEVGYTYPEKNGGNFTRFSTNGSAHDTAGWLRMFPDGDGAAFGCWRSDEQYTWQRKRNGGSSVSPEELAALRQKAFIAQAEAAAQREADYKEKATEARAKVEAAATATSHPYLTKKGIDACGVKVCGDNLLVPVYGPEGIQSYQTIDAEGGKRFMKGGKMSGGFYAIGERTERTIICEGFATGATIHKATGDRVIVAFNSGNLLHVAQALRTKYPVADIVIAGDDDRNSKDNSGRKAAQAAADAVNATAVFPVFAGGQDGTDFNDMAAQCGLEAVQQAFDAGAMADSHLIGYDASSVTGEFQAPDYLIKGVLNRGDMSVTFGDSGSMKSFVELDKALRMGMGWTWNGHKVKRAFTLIVLGEGAGGYRRRIRAWLQHHNRLESNDQPWVWVIDKAAELYSNPQGLKDWIAAVEKKTGRKVDHVLVDTLNTNMGHGADENDAVAIGSMLGFAQSAANYAAITFVHHVGHGDKGRERGSYAIRGNMDNRMLVERDEDGKGKVITVSSLKVKDGEEFKPVNMTYTVEVLGQDADGDDITSLVVLPTELEPQKPAGYGKKGSKNMRQLIDMLAAAGGRMGYPELREKYKEVNPADGKNYSTRLKDLYAAGYIFDPSPMSQVILRGAD